MHPIKNNTNSYINFIIYTTKFPPQLTIANSDFSSASWMMIVLSLGTDDITAQNGITIDVTSPASIGSGNYVNQSVIYNLK